MKTHKNVKIELAASHDAARIAIGEPYLDTTNPDKPVLVATDGRIMAIVPVTDCADDVSGYVSAEVLKAARKASGRSRGEDCVIRLADGHAKLDDESSLPRFGDAKDSKYPNWSYVFPPADRPVKTRITLDAKRLWLLAQAMGTQCVTLEIAEENLPVVVLPATYPFCPVKPAVLDAKGVIMPITVARA